LRASCREEWPFRTTLDLLPSKGAEDRDPLDSLLLGVAPTFPGCLVLVRVIGVIEAFRLKANVECATTGW